MPDQAYETRHPWSHSFYWRKEGRNNRGQLVVSAACPCGWVHMTAYPLLRRRSRVRYLRNRWMTHGKPGQEVGRG